MQGSSSYVSLTGSSANAVEATVFSDQQHRTHHHYHHPRHPDTINYDNSRAAFLAIETAAPTAALAFPTSNSTDQSPASMHNVPTPLPLTSIDMVAPMFSAVASSSPQSFPSSTSFSVPLNILHTSKQTSEITTLIPAESSPNGARKEPTAAAASTSTGSQTAAPGKRGYKSHVPSACINCKKAHLACDVTRPCKRCVALGKTDTCQDIKHKKRGRPRLRDKQSGNNSRDSNYEVMYGAIQATTFGMVPPIAPHPPPINRQPSLIAAPASLAPSSSNIAFVHEISSSFQDHTPPSAAAPNAPITVTHQSHVNSDSTIDTPSNPNSSFFNALPFSFEEVSFPENTNAVQQHYMAQSFLPVSMNTEQQQQQEQSYSSQGHPIIQQYQQHGIRENVSMLAKPDSAYEKRQQQQQQQRPVPIELVPSPTSQQTSSLHLQPTGRHHLQHPPSFQQTSIHTHHHPTPQSSSPPTPSPSLAQRTRQPSIFVPVELHREHVPGSYGDTAKGESDRRDNKPMATIVMSMEVCCARVSSEVTELWGYYPQEFAHRSFYDFISPKDTDRLARLHRLLLDNMVETAQAIDPRYSPPHTERTTSDLFHNCSMEELMLIAPGSSSFSDTLHVKKRSGDMELYEMVVCMGGAFGADLSHPASLSKVYIIGQLKKHDYKVSSRKYSLIDQSVTSLNDNASVRSRFQSLDMISLSSMPQQPSAISMAASSTSTIAMLHHPHHQQHQQPRQQEQLLSPSTSGMVTAHTSTTTPPTFYPAYMPNIGGNGGGGQVFRTASGGPVVRSSVTSAAPSFSLPTRETTRTAGCQELRSTPGTAHSSTTLPSRFKSSSHNSGSKMEPAKVNVAPITMQTKYNANVTAIPQKLSSNTLPSMFRQNNAPSPTPGAVYAGGPSAATAPSISESSNPYSTLASYRLANNSTGPISVTHPTTQYFLRTSSSTLNAAASAAQSITRQKGLYMSAADMADNDKAAGSTDSSRKVEMSIRSLLC